MSFLSWFGSFFGSLFGGGAGTRSVPEFDGTSSIAVAALVISVALVLRARAKQS